MMYLRFLLCGLFSLTFLAFLLKSTLIAWSPQTFASLTTVEMAWALVWGVRFDMAAAAMLFMPVAILTYALQRLALLSSLSLRWLWPPGAALTGMQLANLMYFQQAGRHVGYEINELFLEFSGLMGTAARQHFGLLAVFVLLLAAAWFMTRLCWPAPPRNWRQLEIPVLVWLALSALMIRGSLTDIPMKPDRAFAIGNERQALLALNPAYAMLSNLFEKESATPIYLASPTPSPEFIKKHLGPCLQSIDQSYRPPDKHFNIVLMMLESWPAELMRSYNRKAPEVTPALDSLIMRGLSTGGLIAGGGRTTEGFFSALCSFQNPLGQAITHTRLQSYDYRCLPRLLRDAGWHVAVFEGTHSGTTGQLAQGLGAESAFGKLDMPPPTIPENSWGHHDPDLYRFVLEKARQEDRPFFYIINNATPHDLSLPPGEPWVFGSDGVDQRRMSVLHYADRALGDFLAAYEAANLGKTLFVITADHSVGPRSTNFGWFWIPFLMFATDGSVPVEYKPGIGSHRDIAPTILDFLGGHAPWFSGRSLFSFSPAGGEYFANGILGWVHGQRLIEYSLHDPDIIRCFRRNEGVQFQESQECTPEDLRQRDFLRAFTWYSQSLLFSGNTKDFGLEQPSMFQASEKGREAE